MSLATRAARRAGAILREHGDTVRLPDGTHALGVLDLAGTPAGAPWSEVGLAVRVSQQGNPCVWLLDEVAADIEPMDGLTIRFVDYQVTAPPQADGSGLTRVELARAPLTPAAPGATWL